MDVVWLKKDVRLHDHGPLSIAFSSGRPVIILYIYEPSQLSHPTVHASHVNFATDGLDDLDAQLQELTGFKTPCIARLYGEVVGILHALHSERSGGIARLLAHEETGTYRSFERDIQVRKFCKVNLIPFQEVLQTGAFRALRDRDKFSELLSKFLHAPEHPAPSAYALRSHLVRNIPDVTSYTHPGEDRPARQRGGERAGLACLQSFLTSRGRTYSSSISSPSRSWNACGRISAYLAAGHISLRRTVRLTEMRIRELQQKFPGQNSERDAWIRSLRMFNSRLHWRAHFIQKLEREPEIEFRAMHGPCDKLRTKEGDWNERFFQAWKTGRTGYPLVDACMRCLLHSGWINFRMRAMLVSFATHNLWLDWRSIAAHLAQCFLDYEPGIHYPQLQMQAAVTGINTMRVYSASKQAKDQDPDGVFIKRYVPELRSVPKANIHEPHKMTKQEQISCGVYVCDEQEFLAMQMESTSEQVLLHYPKPIVDEQVTARVAKERIAAARASPEARAAAKAVLDKHGSRAGWMRAQRPKGVVEPTPPSLPRGQTTITSMAKGTAKVMAGLNGTVGSIKVGDQEFDGREVKLEEGNCNDENGNRRSKKEISDEREKTPEKTPRKRQRVGSGLGMKESIQDVKRFGDKGEALPLSRGQTTLTEMLRSGKMTHTKRENNGVSAEQSKAHVFRQKVGSFPARPRSSDQKHARVVQGKEKGKTINSKNRVNQSKSRWQTYFSDGANVRDDKEKLETAWTCGACTLINEKELAPVCAACGTQRSVP